MNEADMFNGILVILEAANQGLDNNNNNARTTMMAKATTTTRIMYTALFNHSQLRGYWEALIQRGLLGYDFDTQTFKTTEKGRLFLKAYRDMDYDLIKAQLKQQQLATPLPR
jgi:predicted transcriptional regulator